MGGIVVVRWRSADGAFESGVDSRRPGITGVRRYVLLVVECG